jgi:hypothetical protein
MNDDINDREGDQLQIGTDRGVQQQQQQKKKKKPRTPSKGSIIDLFA